MTKETFQKRVKAMAAGLGCGVKFDHNEVQNAATMVHPESPEVTYLYWNNVHGDAVYMQVTNHETKYTGPASRAPGLEDDTFIK